MDITKNTIEVFNKNAALYQDKFMNVDSYSNSLDTFCNNIENENAAILDVACGPGNITQYLLKKHPSYKILGIDLAEAMLALAKANNPNATFKIMDGRNILALGKKYHAIVAGFCFPYFSKEEAIQFIADSAAILLPDGALYLSTMEDDYSNSGMVRASSGDEAYMYYHQADYLTEALLANGFEIIDIARQDYTYNNKNETDLILVVKKAA